ncbi:hypothetical protein J1780_03555 [Rahnella aceris]|uniref:hypothetical protein n=1 Tax=Rahnella sp. (strain Y9602) TaxID=2703885 RepID=UPI001C276B88|nr:hypothetical protein [Rahnella aceris]MBU9839032.1 hypothetical protein [Rahnella aceris]
MSNDFIWDPKRNQIFNDSYGGYVTLTNKNNSDYAYEKDASASFMLDTKFSLALNDANVIIWNGNFELINGELLVGSPNSTFLPELLSVQTDNALTSFRNQGKFYAHVMRFYSDRLFELSGDSLTSITATTRAVINGVYDVKDNAKLYIKLESGRFNCDEGRVTLINNAVCEIATNDIDILSYRFNLGMRGVTNENGNGSVNNAVMVFKPLSGDNPFDFRDDSRYYPEGLFNFEVVEGVKNGGRLEFYGSNMNAFQYTAMTSRRLLSINGAPINNEGLLRCYMRLTPTPVLVIEMV